MYPDEDEPQVDITKLRYVLYARKSTDDPKRQIRSINDQIDECKLLAERSGMRIVKVLKEEKSAKKPNNRKVFNEMMRGIESGKYDGIASWNPDRLARNMIEGSHILNLIDEGTIQDLKFVTHYFTNDASGKMLLGISFVMADYCSRNLSQNVTRGVRKGLKEGKSSGTPKQVISGVKTVFIAPTMKMGARTSTLFVKRGKCVRLVNRWNLSPST